jgi:hypothetical protein
MSDRNMILVKGADELTREEGRAAAAINPGYLITFNGDQELIPHATAGVDCEMVALEDALQGKTVDDAYADDDLVFYHIAHPGDVLQLVLQAGENADEDDYLTSNGDGTVQVTAGAESTRWRAMEALDLSGGGAVDTFIRARRV